MAIVSITDGLGGYVDAYSDVSLTNPSLDLISDGEIVGEDVANRPHNELLVNDEALRDQMKNLELGLHNNYYTKYDLNTSGRSTVHWGNLSNIPDFNHNTLPGLQGTGPDYFHLNLSEYDKLKAIPQIDQPPAQSESVVNLGSTIVLLKDGPFVINLAAGSYFFMVVGGGGGGGNGGTFAGAAGGNGGLFIDLIELNSPSALNIGLTVGRGGHSGYRVGAGLGPSINEEPTAGTATIVNITGDLFRNYSASGGAAGANGQHADGGSTGGPAPIVTSDFDTISGVPIISGFPNGFLYQKATYGGTARSQYNDVSKANLIGGHGGLSGGNSNGAAGYAWAIAYTSTTVTRGLGTGGRGGSGGAYWDNDEDSEANGFPQGGGGGGGAQGCLIIQSFPVV